MLGEQTEVLERMSGTELAERYRSYQGPIFDIGEPGDFPILTDEFVTTDDGTGIVHLAPAFGEDDYRVAGASERVAFDPTRSGHAAQPGASGRHLRRDRAELRRVAPTRDGR